MRQQKFAKYLKSWRKRLKLSQSQASKKLDIPLSTLTGWEGDKIPLNEGVMRLVCEHIERAGALPKPPKTHEPLEDYLRLWRTRMGFTQTRAAAALCTSPRTYQGWEIGRPAANEVLLRQLCRQIEGAEPELTRPPRRPKPVSAALDFWE